MRMNDDGGIAFPVAGSGHQGMSLRDYFAAHAPIALIDANESLHQQSDAAKFAKVKGDEVFPMVMLVKELARMRIAYADAMIAERRAGAV